MKTQQNGLWATVERKNRLMKVATEKAQNNFPKEVLVLEEKLTEVHSGLFEAKAGLRKLTVERRKVELEERQFSDTSRVGWNQRSM